MTASTDDCKATRSTVVVLYAETRGFTRMSEILEPDVVLARIDEFFKMVSAAVTRHDGVVRSLLNDNAIATFAGLLAMMGAANVDALKGRTGGFGVVIGVGVLLLLAVVRWMEGRRAS